MEIYIYIITFIIGLLLGSFFSLATYRIPLNEDITHKRSYCPKCKHNLNFMDLIPIISYITLKGKCRYCKEKISIRYILLEIFTGLIFLLFVMSLKINIYSINISQLILLTLSTIYISTLFIIGQIEKEKHIIPKQVLLIGLIFDAMYIAYLYILHFSIYKYVICLSILLILIIIDTLLLRKKAKTNYTIDVLMLCIYLLIGTNEEAVILSIIITLFLVAIKEIFIKFKEQKDLLDKEEIESQISIGFYLCFSNIIILIIQNFLR